MSIYEDREGSGGANEVAIGLPLEAGHEGGLVVERLGLGELVGALATPSVPTRV
jgi:hypothetical protein